MVCTIAGFVKPLGREVSSRYAGDAFSQQRSPASGELFNVSYKCLYYVHLESRADTHYCQLTVGLFVSAAHVLSRKNRSG